VKLTEARKSLVSAQVGSSVNYWLHQAAPPAQQSVTGIGQGLVDSVNIPQLSDQSLETQPN
jgi:hypothetical protein